MYYNFPFTKAILLFPVLTLLTLLCSMGMGFWLSSLNVMYRDVKHIIPFFIRLGIFITPVIYPVSIISKDIKWLLYLNPMAGLIESFRASLLGHRPIPVFGLSVSVVMTMIFLVSGVYFFRKREKVFADEV